MRQPLTIRFRRALRSEDGFSLVELLVALMILGLVLSVFYSVLGSVQRDAVRQDNLSRTNDQARLAVEQLDREIRSGNVLYNPASESPANYTLRVYTQSNATTRTPAPGYVCALWTINANHELVTRQWPPLQPEDATPWRLVAEGVVNRVVSPNVPAFALDPDPNKGSRTIEIILVVNNNVAGYGSQTVRIEESITGRNTSYGFPQNVCSQTPT